MDSKSFKAITTLFIFSVLSFVIKTYVFKEEPVDSVLARTAIELNQSFPQVIDDMTRIDSAKVA